jgi:hypothetical protein
LEPAQVVHVGRVDDIAAPGGRSHDDGVDGHGSVDIGASTQPGQRFARELRHRFLDGIDPERSPPPPADAAGSSPPLGDHDGGNGDRAPLGVGEGHRVQRANARTLEADEGAGVEGHASHSARIFARSAGSIFTPESLISSARATRSAGVAYLGDECFLRLAVLFAGIERILAFADMPSRRSRRRAEERSQRSPEDRVDAR